MKSLTVRLPEQLVAEIEAESRRRNVPKSDVVRERLQTPHAPGQPAQTTSMMDVIGDLVGSVKGLPADLSRNKKKYLPGLIRAHKLPRR